MRARTHWRAAAVGGSGARCVVRAPTTGWLAAPGSGWCVVCAAGRGCTVSAADSSYHALYSMMDMIAAGQ